MIASDQVSSTTNIPTAEQKRLVIVGATGMVGGYAFATCWRTRPSQV
jgi:hypothetical protein